MDKAQLTFLVIVAFVVLGVIFGILTSHYPWLALASIGSGLGAVLTYFLYDRSKSSGMDL